MPERETRYTSAGAITSAKRESKQTNKIDSRFVFVVTLRAFLASRRVQTATDSTCSANCRSNWADALEIRHATREDFQ